MSAPALSQTLPDSPENRPAAWWRDAVIYQVYIRSFADGNGDGVGDLLGVRTRLPYLRELGVDAVWITPFYASPMADGGYDVAEHREVDPLFGTLGDAEALIAEAHALGLKVIFDIVPNHTSAAHRWFREALAAGPGSAARERYLFRPGKGEDGGLPPNDWESVFGGPAWTRIAEPDGSPGEWYLHLFDPAQPDLDWRHPEVRAEHEEILRFWLDRGVDGFRIDVAHGMVKQEGLPDAGYTDQIEMLGSSVLPYFDQDEVHEIHRSWRRILDSYPGERIAVAEAWAPSIERLAAYVRPDEAHQAFNFHFLGTAWDADALRRVIADSVRTAELVGATSTWVLSNHDIRRHVTRYGGGEAGLRRARAAALLMLALPGSAYLYQGEELGLEEVLDLPEELLQDPQRLRSADGSSGRDGCRVPLPWGGEESPYGFTPLGIAEGWLPAPARWRGLTVEKQWEDPSSTLGLYRRALKLRREIPGLGDGRLEWRDAPRGALVFTRGPGFACTVNASGQPVAVPHPGRLILASTALPDAAQGCAPAAEIVLPPDSAAWWHAG
ncbi:glycoside hydrolase family 13 protein [Actinospica sp. MGRD01-02]|uniref:Glycoside hydrolase family 13 protein n=1 Tax=Actinospica acidithermotolerans TaxID=2828514 RepID=A0A941E9L2_9ACTN|nr:glycoside hydrolase family 13 protein [Actinospica acidithermotolerans]MBR7825069.1 glycoside hydrolase family 13 protein [Actinospica acidithermotolerans]